MANNPASILDSIKKALGFDSTFTDFDLDIIMHTNTFFASLQQIGTGPKTGFVIVDNSLLWSDYSTNMVLLAAVQSYLYLKIRAIFDPPATSFVIDSYEKLASELEFRISVMAEQIDPPSDPFNPTATTTPTVAAFWWDLTGLSDFPDEALVGDLGIDMTTGNVWRKT